MELCFVDYKEKKRKCQVSEISWLTVCFVCVAFCFDHVMLMSYCMVIKQWVLIYCRGRGWTRNMSHAVLLLKFCFVHVEFCTNGMVFVIFGFFCRSGNPIEVSRWVKLCVNLCVTFGYVKVLVCFFSLHSYMFLVRGRRMKRHPLEESGGSRSLPRVLGRGSGNSE